MFLYFKRALRVHFVARALSHAPAGTVTTLTLPVYARGIRRQIKNLEDVVLQFTLGRGDVLLATSIIENGIDMPNVNSIVVQVYCTHDTYGAR